MDDLVSVVIPFYSGASWLEEAINSVVNQSYKHIEIILINDGSDENIDSIISKYEKKIKYIKTINKGAAAARNRGIYESKGKYIAFLDSDDIWEEDKLYKQVNYLYQNPDIKWCITSYKVFDDSDRSIIKTKDCKRFDGDVFPKILYSSPIATPTVVVRKEILDRLQLRFQENLKYGEDSCLWIKLSLNSNLGLIKEPLANIRWRGTNAASNILAQICARKTVFEEMLNYELFKKKQYKISLIARLNLKYCNWLVEKIIVKRKIKNERVLNLLYLPARIVFKILSDL